MARVLVYTNHFFPENFKVNEIVDFLGEEKHEVQVVTCVPNYPAGKIYDGYGFFKKHKEQKGSVFIRRLPMVPRGSGSKLRIILNYLSYFVSTVFYTLKIALFGKRYDVLFVHHTSPIFIAITPILYKLFRRKTKLVLWDLDIWPDTLSAVGVVNSKGILSFIEKIIKRIYVTYDHILVGSKSFVDIVESRVKNVPVSYFPNWAEDLFTEGKIVQPEQEPSFKDGFKVMFAGNIGTAQDVENMFEAAKILKGQGIQWCFVGDGRMRKWLEEQAEVTGLKDEFTFYGNNPITLMPYFFSKADVMLVSLKDQEIFRKTVPAKVQAYMASGKAILGMLSGEGGALITDAKCGLACDSGDAKGLANNILQLSKLPASEVEQMGKNGLDFFNTHFRKEIRFKQLAGILGI